MASNTKRKPAGAAVPGAVDRPLNYPTSVNALITQELKDEITAEAAERGVSQGTVAREMLEAGRAARKA